MNQKPTPGKTPFQKFQALAKGLMKVPKVELDKKIQEQRERARKRTKQ
jgi:hypothetical protein